MVTPRVDFRHPINALSAWVSRLRTSSDDIPTAYEVAQRAVEAFLGRDGAERVAVEQAARTYQHTTSRQDDDQVHTHALVPSVDGIVDFDGLDTSRLTVEVDPDEPWGWPLYERWTPEAAAAAAREQAAQCRQLAAAWGRLARDKRLKRGDPTTSEAFQRHYQREAEPTQARERAERVLALQAEPARRYPMCVDDEFDRAHVRRWSM
jgi:hypothetical protein